MGSSDCATSSLECSVGFRVDMENVQKNRLGFIEPTVPGDKVGEFSGLKTVRNTFGGSN